MWIHYNYHSTKKGAIPALPTVSERHCEWRASVQDCALGLASTPLCCCCDRHGDCVFYLINKKLVTNV
ncbi:unnamed protein product [Brassica oleracea var. botrytis]|uniref:Uncharacterized protein n=1 Tax=Brassica oleracea TaxID=3712 RepID=A0A3P6CLT0_BRAOL|nr:unnamed protein product [Brassica oleracea]